MANGLTKDLLLGIEENPVWRPYRFRKGKPEAYLWDGDPCVVAFEASKVGPVTAFGRAEEIQVDHRVKGGKFLWILDGSGELSMLKFDDVVVIGRMGSVSFYTRDAMVSDGSSR